MCLLPGPCRLHCAAGTIARCDCADHRAAAIADDRAAQLLLKPTVRQRVGGQRTATVPRFPQIFAELAPVENARVVGTQCYAFVRFQSPRDAAYIMEVCLHPVKP